MTHAKRWLFLAHRWLGIVACAFFAMWFVSGVVMMYVGYPRLTEAERLAHLPPLDGAAAAPLLLAPRAALDAASLAGPLRELRLARASGGRAVYVATPEAEGAPHAASMAMPMRASPPGSGAVVVDAVTGAVLREVDAARALAAAAAFAGPGVALRDEGTVDEDAFTHSRALDAHRPLHRVRLDDSAGTRLYVSGVTGEVVRDAPRTERVWNYAGAWIHWLYPLRGGVFDPWWAAVVEGLAIVGIGVAVTGSVVGTMRWRFRGRYKSGSRSPYRGAAMRWHHVAGLLFAITTLTWMFSGLMSMNPWHLFDGGAPALRTQAMNGGPLRVDPGFAAPDALLAAARRDGATSDVRELRWRRVAGADVVEAVGGMAGAAPLLLDAATARPRAVDPVALRAAVARLVDAPVVRIDVLRAHDLHYYTREAHTMTGGTDRPLPAWRVVFADVHATWVHVDPRTGAVLGRTDDGRRASRWLFAMLHSWDWLPLIERRPLWDAVLVAASAGGLALSLTGLVIGVRRLRRKAGRGGRNGERGEGRDVGG